MNSEIYTLGDDNQRYGSTPRPPFSYDDNNNLISPIITVGARYLPRPKKLQEPSSSTYDKYKHSLYEQHDKPITMPEVRYGPLQDHQMHMDLISPKITSATSSIATVTPHGQVFHHGRLPEISHCSKGSNSFKATSSIATVTPHGQVFHHGQLPETSHCSKGSSSLKIITPQMKHPIEAKVNNINVAKKKKATTSLVTKKSARTYRNTSTPNPQKRKKMYSDYVGVTFNKTHNKFQACITHFRKQHYLGRYRLAVDAAKAYDESAKLLKGAGWKINFSSEKDFEKAKQAEIGNIRKEDGSAIVIEGRKSKIRKREEEVPGKIVAESKKSKSQQVEIETTQLRMLPRSDIHVVSRTPSYESYLSRITSNASLLTGLCEKKTESQQMQIQKTQPSMPPPDKTHTVSRTSSCEIYSSQIGNDKNNEKNELGNRQRSSASSTEENNISVQAGLFEAASALMTLTSASYET